MDPITLRFTYNEEEYARAAGVYQLKRGGILRTYGLYFVLIVALILVFGFFQGYFDRPLAIIMPVLVTALGFGSLFFTLPRGWKKTFRTDPRNRLPFTWQITEQGLSITTAETQARFEWPFFRELLETEAFFYLVGAQQKNQLFFAPKRAFASADQIEQFRALARQFIRLEQIG